MATIIKAIKGDYRELDTNNLYKVRDDNKLTTEELIDKYEDRIVQGSIPSRVLEIREVEERRDEVLSGIFADLEHLKIK